MVDEKSALLFLIGEDCCEYYRCLRDIRNQRKTEGERDEGVFITMG